MAKKAGRPKKPRGEGQPVRLDPGLVEKARIVAMRRGVPMGEYLSGLLEGPVGRHFQAILDERDDKPTTKSSP